MTRFVVTFLLVVLFVAGTASCPNASTMDLLAEPTAHSLRGESINLDDVWSNARLLAHFGEQKRAYEILRRRSSIGPLDPQVERFEARLLTEIGMPARADSLLALQTYTGDRLDYYVLCLRRARLNVMADRPARALDFLGLVDSLSVEAFDPYRDYLMLQAHATLEQYEAAYDIGKRRLAQGVPRSLSPAFEELLFDAYVAGEAYAQASRLVKTLKVRKKREATYAAIFAREVELLIAVGDTAAAIEGAVATVKKSRSSLPQVQAVTSVITAVDPSELSSEALLLFADVMLSDRNLADVDRLIDELRERELDDNDDEQRRLLQGQLYYRERRYSRAYKLIEAPFENASLERSAMLYRARIFRKTGQSTRSADAYVAFATKFPYDAKAAEALFVASDLYERTNNRQRELTTLAKISSTYPSHRYGRLAAVKRALYYIDRGEHDRAVTLLEETLRGTGRRSDALLYYLAVAYGAKGAPDIQSKIMDELRALNPGSFYLDASVTPSHRQPMMGSDGRIVLTGNDGLLTFLSESFQRRERAFEHIRSQLDPVPDPSTLDPYEPYLRRGRLFLELGFRDWAQNELQVIERHKRLPSRVSLELGVLYDDFAMHWKSTRAFQRVYYSFPRNERRELDAEFKLLMYPIPFPALVFENCSRYRISPHIIYAMMRQESRFQVDAVSSAGARGLMQLMPATSEQVATELGFPDGIQHNIFSPEVNLTFGIWYASYLLERSNDNPLMMLSAYNAGFGNARRWFSSGESSTVAVVDGVDYRETRDYVKRIVENAHVYYRFYFAGDDRADDRVE